MFITCRNSKCKYYWEDCCTKDLKGERLSLDCDGKCDDFGAGVSDFYKAEEEADNEE